MDFFPAKNYKAVMRDNAATRHSSSAALFIAENK